MLVTAKYGEPMVADYKESEWYNVFHIEPDGVIKSLHCQYATFDGQNLNLFIVDDSSLTLWEALFEYGVKEKAKLHHVVLYYYQRDVREMCDAKAFRYYWND